MMNKLVVICPETQITYVIPFDPAVFEDAFECIEAANKEFELSINPTNCSFLEVDEFNLKVL